MGGVFLRSSLLERPLFAKLVKESQKRAIKTFADSQGFEDLATVGANRKGKCMLFAAMKHEISEHTATGRRMNHLLQPLIVSVFSGDCRSHMTVENFGARSMISGRSKPNAALRSDRF